MKHDGSDWYDRRFGRHITRTEHTHSQGYVIASCTCGWTRIAGNTDRAALFADRHERRARRPSWLFPI